jgi:hypothetical protein
MTKAQANEGDGRRRLERLAALLRRPAVSSALAALVVTTVLYSGAARLPFFSDDLVQIPWIESLSWSEIWTEGSPFGDHRPLWALAWRAWGVVAGGLRPVDLHVVNLALHALAAWLVGLLAAEWGGQTTEGNPAVLAVLGAATFACFAFSREAVVWASAFSYPLSTVLALGTVMAYGRSRETGSRLWLGAALLLAALASLAYEAGLIASALVILAEAVGRISRRWPRSPRGLVLFSVLLALQLTVWRVAWTADSILHTLTATDILENGAFLLQGLVHPAAWLAQRFVPPGVSVPLPLLLVLAAGTVAVLLWSGLRQGERQALALGAGWFVVASAPALLARKGIVDAPRFLYPAAAGVALVWASALAGWLRRPWGRAAVAVALAVILLVFVSSAVYVRHGMWLYRVAGQVLWEAVAAAEEAPSVLLVNLPMRLTPSSRVYALGFEGVIPLTPEVTADQLVYVHTGASGIADAASFGIALVDTPRAYDCEVFGPPLGWQELAAAVRQAQSVYLTRYDSGEPRLVEAGGRQVAGWPGEPLALFGNDLALLNLSSQCGEGGRVRVTALWRLERQPRADATVFAHLLDSSGSLVSQADGYPLAGLLPFWLWRVDEVMRDERAFTPVEPGDYTVQLGVWELATGEHWLAEGWPGGVVSSSVSCP